MIGDPSIEWNSILRRRLAGYHNNLAVLVDLYTLDFDTRRPRSLKCPGDVSLTEYAGAA